MTDKAHAEKMAFMDEVLREKEFEKLSREQLIELLRDALTFAKSLMAKEST